MARKRILIVEDEIVSAMFLRRVLEQLGYAVTGIVSNGEAAVQQAQEQRPHLLLVDVRLRGRLDGIAAAKQIKDLTGIGSIIVSACGKGELMGEYGLSVEFPYLRKPIAEDQLEAALETAFAGGT
jgi:CheY-like chemotaxis protein